MHVFHRFSIAGFLLLGFLISAFTLTLPHETTAAAMKAGPVWMGKPFAFSAMDFSMLDPPPGPRHVSANPWEIPTVDNNVFLLMVDVLIYAVPLWALAAIIELAIRRKSILKL